MTHTYYQNLYHLVWSTTERRPLLPSQSKHRVFEYLAGAAKTAECLPVQIGGMPDHVHLLLAIPPKHAVSHIVRDIKICSTKWIKSVLPDSQSFAWQEGFGSFSVSASQKEAVMQYIANQEEHHKTRTFQEEFTTFLKIHSVQYDEAFLWR